jgi:hypothetical protein
MIEKPKYKSLIRLKTDVWNNLNTKKLNNKKWTLLKTILKKRINRNYPKIPKVRDYFTREASKFVVYFRYKHQKNLTKRLYIRYIYGYLQHYKIKFIAKRSKKKSWLGYIHALEQTASSFLYRTKFVITYSEAFIHQKRQRILVNGKTTKPNIKKGDILHFKKHFENLIRRRWLKYYFLRSRNKYKTHFIKRRIKNFFYLGIYEFITFDVNNFCFNFLKNLMYFKNHPFKIPFEQIIWWYTRI